MGQLHYQAPADAEQFWARDGGFVYGLVRKLMGPGVNVQDAEDAAADIIEKLLQAKNEARETVGILALYDPDKIAARTGRNVTWRGFLGANVALRVRGKREQLAHRAGRELLLCDTQAGDGGERWVELFGGQRWDDYPSLTDEQFAERMRDYLATVPDSWEGGSLYRVFTEILELVRNGERVTRVAGLSRRETAAALARIRQVAPDALARPLGAVTVAGVHLTPAEARDALDRLRGSTGNHVHRPLAGHRLMAEAPKGWYHEFAREELDRFPDAGVEARAGKIGGAGAGHVKAAVIHGLARLLAGTPEPEPAPEPEEPTREELLEAELWHITGLDAGKIDAIIAAAQKVYA